MTKTVPRKQKTQFTDKRRRHSHYQVTVFYADGEKFARVYTDKQKATNFAARQKKSPVVKMARVAEVNAG